MIIVPKFKELEVEVYFIRNCFEVLYCSFWVLKKAGKQAPRLRSYFSSMSTSKRAHYATVGDP